MRDARRSALIVLAAGFVLGVAGLLLAAALDDRRLAFTLGVQPTQVAAVLQRGDTACQGPIDVPADARSLRFPVGTFRAPGPQLEVSVRTTAGIAGVDTIPAGYRDNSTVPASPAGVESGRRIAVCVRNAGPRKVALYGGALQAARTSALGVRGRDARTDLTLVFERAEPRSMLSALPDAISRAALFRPGWVSTGLLWALAILLVTAFPAALLAALRTSPTGTPSSTASGPLEPDSGHR